MQINIVKKSKYRINIIDNINTPKSIFIIMSIIIHQQSYFCGGIGDMLRGIITLFTYSKKYNIDYYVSFAGNQELNECFTVNPIPDRATYLQSMNINLLDKLLKPEHNHILLTMFNLINLNPPALYNIVSNACNVMPKVEFLSCIPFITTNIIKPSKKVETYIEMTMTPRGLIENKYISFHFRCGDVYIAKENNSSEINRHRDTRFLINDDNYSKYEYAVKTFILRYNINTIETPIIIHSDCLEFKNTLIARLLQANVANVMSLDLDIQHTANKIGINSSSSYIETVAEFYIMSRAKSIVMYDVYSGFSHLASIIGNKPLYTLCEDERIDALGPEQVIKIDYST